MKRLGLIILLISCHQTIYAQSYDGPAELPLSTPSSTYPDSCGFKANEASPDACGFAITYVKAGDTTTLQSDLNSAGRSPACGSNGLIIAIAPGTPAMNLSISLPKNGCGGNRKWIIIRPNVNDSALPPAGARIQSNPTQLASEAQFVGSYSPSLFTITATAAGTQAAYYWLMGLDVASLGGMPGTAVAIGCGGGACEQSVKYLPDHITIDRCTLHAPSLTQDIQQALQLDATNAVAINNYIYSIHYVTGEGHGILSWVSPGPMLIQNNYVEGAAQAIFFGGADPPSCAAPDKSCAIAADVTITDNEIAHSPDYWQGWSGYIGVNSIVKNLIELKQGKRFLIENNTLTGNWDGYGQYGYALVVTPRNSSGAFVSVTDEDITFRNNTIEETMGVFACSTSIPGYGNGSATNGIRRLSIHDNTAQSIGCSHTHTGLGTYADGCQAGLMSLVSQDLTGGTLDSVSIQSNVILPDAIGQYWTFLTSGPLNGYPITHLTFTGNQFFWGTISTSPGLGITSAQGLNNCSAMMFEASAGDWSGNTFVGVPAGSVPGYTTCQIQAPPPPHASLVSGSSALTNGQQYYFRATYTSGSAETTASTAIVTGKSGRWGAGRTFNLGSHIQDSNGGEQIAYWGTNTCGAPSCLSGSLEPVWSTATGAMTCDGRGTLVYSALSDPCKNGSTKEITWVYLHPGVNGAITIPASGSHPVSVGLQIQDHGPQTGWKLYASKDGSNYYLQTQCGTAGVMAVATSCTLSSFTSGTAAPPKSNNTAVTAPAWASL